MIRQYNKSQTLRAILYFIGGLACTALTFLFFRFLANHIAVLCRYSPPPSAAALIGVAGVAVAWFSGYRSWKNGGGLYSYHESGLYHDFGDETGSAYYMNFHAHRVTGPAYVLGQIFLSGPLAILKGWTLWNSRIPGSAELQSRLEKSLGVLAAANKWQGFTDHPEMEAEILYLAQMDLIDFSAREGVARFKAK